MSIQRYGDPGHDYMIPADDEGFVVLYADHVAAVAAAQREGSNQGYLNGVAANVDNSFKAGVKAARDAVDAVWSAPDGLLRGLCNHAEALAAIDAIIGGDINVSGQSGSAAP